MIFPIPIERALKEGCTNPKPAPEKEEPPANKNGDEKNTAVMNNIDFRIVYSSGGKV